MARSRSVGFFRSQLIWIYTVCKGRVYPGSTGTGLKYKPHPSQLTVSMIRDDKPEPNSQSSNLAHQCESIILSILELQHQKTYLRECVPREDPDQPAHSCSLIRIFTGHILDNQGCKVSSCTQQRLWSDYSDAQADLRLCWKLMQLYLQYSLGKRSSCCFLLFFFACVCFVVFFVCLFFNHLPAIRVWYFILRKQFAWNVKPYFLRKKKKKKKKKRENIQNETCWNFYIPCLTQPANLKTVIRNPYRCMCSN